MSSGTRYIRNFPGSVLQGPAESRPRAGSARRTPRALRAHSAARRGCESFGAGARRQGQHGRGLSATGLALCHLSPPRTPVPLRTDAAEVPSAGCRCVSAGSRDKTAPVSHFLWCWKSPKRREVITNSAGKMLASADCRSQDEGCCVQWVPRGGPASLHRG